ncbi:hypothetical protein AC579_4565 [Pseudocercospora musae]|uniref:Uncharacterized protein n=1 Tax=Pseudocercospora musae TaxID=113226 RepID=A0A139IU74_9PEZI|nr:hypothetical protein AC579_4565 [Pseudocercospora musae]
MGMLIIVLNPFAVYFGFVVVLNRKSAASGYTPGPETELGTIAHDAAADNVPPASDWYGWLSGMNCPSLKGLPAKSKVEATAGTRPFGRGPFSPAIHESAIDLERGHPDIVVSPVAHKNRVHASWEALREERLIIRHREHRANVGIICCDIVDTLAIAQLGRERSQRKALGEVAHIGKINSTALIVLSKVRQYMYSRSENAAL